MMKNLVLVICVVLSLVLSGTAFADPKVGEILDKQKMFGQKMTFAEAHDAYFDGDLWIMEETRRGWNAQYIAQLRDPEQVGNCLVQSVIYNFTTNKDVSQYRLESAMLGIIMSYMGMRIEAILASDNPELLQYCGFTFKEYQKMIYAGF